MIKGLLKDAWPIIESAAPTIARAVGGVPGVAISYVLPLLYRAFNAEKGNIPELINNIVNSPNAKDILSDVEHEHGDWLCTMLDSVGQLESVKFNVEIQWKK
jgi:hypothetical protein